MTMKTKLDIHVNTYLEWENYKPYKTDNEKNHKIQEDAIIFLLITILTWSIIQFL